MSLALFSMIPRRILYAALTLILMLLTVNQALALTSYPFIKSDYIEWIAPLAGFVKDIVIAISAATTAFFAYKGVDTWRKELKGKSEYQLAKDVLRAVYKVREAFKAVRNPLIMTHEYPDEMKHVNGHLKSESFHEGTLYVYQERWKQMNDAFIELENKYLEAVVEWVCNSSAQVGQNSLIA